MGTYTKDEINWAKTMHLSSLNSLDDFVKAQSILREEVERLQGREAEVHRYAESLALNIKALIGELRRRFPRLDWSTVESQLAKL